MYIFGVDTEINSFNYTISSFIIRYIKTQNFAYIKLYHYITFLKNNQQFTAITLRVVYTSLPF